MTDLRLHQLPDGDLEGALRNLAGAVDWPSPTPVPKGPDLATRVRARIVASPPAKLNRRRWSWWPARRALVLALVGLLAVAAVATAVGVGVPGIRLIFGEPPVTPPPIATANPSPSSTAGPPGAGIGLGDPVALEDLDERAGFPIRLPTDPVAGAPDTAYRTAEGTITVVWAASDRLPPTVDPQIGLLLTQFRGVVEPEGMTKMIDQGVDVEPVTVDGARGFWISGDVHFFFYKRPDGTFVDDSRRWVGDALIWHEGEVTYRIETALGRDAAIRIAESLR